MFNKFFIFLLLFLSFYIIQLKASSYDNYDGKYTYSKYTGENANINNLNLNKDEEILIILDFSSSMQKKLNDQPRINYAVNALRNVIDKLPDDTKIGLRIFGPDEKSLTMYRSGTGINTNRDCRASKLEVPIASNNKSNIKNRLSGYYRPFGESPIGYSLRQAINNDFLLTESLKHIVLITDGKEGCGDDPCRYIRELMTTRDDIKIDVIGISTDENAYSQLSCLASTTKGKYFIVRNIDDLYLSIETAVTSVSPLDIQEKISNYSKQNINTSQYPNFNNNQNIIQKDSIDNKSKNKNIIKYSNYAFEFDI